MAFWGSCVGLSKVQVNRLIHGPANKANHRANKQCADSETGNKSDTPRAKFIDIITYFVELAVVLIESFLEVLKFNLKPSYAGLDVSQNLRFHRTNISWRGVWGLGSLIVIFNHSSGHRPTPTDSEGRSRNSY